MRTIVHDGLQDGAPVKNTSRTTPPRRTSRGTVFVDIYLDESSQDDVSALKLVARFRGRRSAQRALDQPEFLHDLVRSGGKLYMSTVGGKSPKLATKLPTETDEDERCWFKAYPRITDTGPCILWSLIWPKPDEVDELLDLIIRV